MGRVKQELQIKSKKAKNKSAKFKVRYISNNYKSSIKTPSSTTLSNNYSYSKQVTPASNLRYKE